MTWGIDLYAWLQMHPSIAPFDEFEARRCCRGPHDALKWMLKMQTAPEDTAAIIIEPILGEGGFVAPPPDFLSTLRKYCDEHGIVMIIDEVKSAALSVIGKATMFVLYSVATL